jgi:branched-chain amino acid transport system ATP-binding protein
MLRTDGLTRRFGGLVAVDHVDFELGDELCSLIGPNGAGKTTFFDCLTGTLPPSEGTIEFRPGGTARSDGGADAGPVDEDDPGWVARDDDRASNARGDDSGSDGDGWVDITDASPAETASLGIHRSYQLTTVFPNSSVLENVRIAAQAGGGDATVFWRNVGAFDRYYEEAHAILDRVGLDGKAEQPAGALSHGEKRQLEVAIALAGDPDVLLLDEPNAGVSSESVGDIIDLIQDVATDHAVLLVEHNMDIVMEVSDRIAVLHQGAIIADGPPEEVRGDSAVQEAYLGGYEAGDGDDEAAGDAAADGGWAT